MEREDKIQETTKFEIPFGFVEELLSWDEPMERRGEILEAFLEEMNLSLYGQRLMFARKQRNLSIKQVSKFVGISKATLKKYETGNYFGKSRAGNVLKIAEALRVSFDYLAGRSFTLVGSICAEKPSLITHISECIEINDSKDNTISA